MSTRSQIDATPVRLDQQQRTIVFPLSQVLEHATNVFGNQQLAEEWLKKPCKYLAERAPMDLIEDTQGFQMVENYLARFEHGVYQ